MRTIDKRAKVTRRNFLKSGAAVAGVTAIAGGATVTVDPNGAWAMTTQHLKPETMVTLVKMARDLYPTTGWATPTTPRPLKPMTARPAPTPRSSSCSSRASPT